MKLTDQNPQVLSTWLEISNPHVPREKRFLRTWRSRDRIEQDVNPLLLFLYVPTYSAFFLFFLLAAAIEEKDAKETVQSIPTYP